MSRSSIHSLAANVHRFIKDSVAKKLSDDVFNALAVEVIRFQAETNPVVGRFLSTRGVEVDALSGWSQIPALPLTAFKEFEVSCLPASERLTWFESSGTTGERRSRHFHNQDSLAVYEESLMRPFAHHVRPLETAVFLSLTPPRMAAPHSSLVHMLETACEALPFQQMVFAGVVDAATGWVLDWEKAVHVMNAAISDGTPVLICGTAFQYVHLMDGLPGPLKLPAGSRAMETGGYKGRSRELTREELHLGISASLGIRRDHIIREYGMSELGSQAYDRVCGREDMGFRFPPWARTRLVSPETGLEASDGEAGLIQICDLANMASAIMIETADLAVASGGNFQLLGRAAFAEPKGCSLLSAQ